jgi:hypothetical protein
MVIKPRGSSEATTKNFSGGMLYRAMKLGLRPGMSSIFAEVNFTLRYQQGRWCRIGADFIQGDSFSLTTARSQEVRSGRPHALALSS